MASALVEIAKKRCLEPCAGSCPQLICLSSCYLKRCVSAAKRNLARTPPGEHAGHSNCPRALSCNKTASSSILAADAAEALSEIAFGSCKNFHPHLTNGPQPSPPRGARMLRRRSVTPSRPNQTHAFTRTPSNGVWIAGDALEQLPSMLGRHCLSLRRRRSSAAQQRSESRLQWRLSPDT